MKFASFNDGHIGLVRDDQILDITGLGTVPAGSWPPVGMVKFIADFETIRPRIDAAAGDAPRHALSSVRLDCPVQWPNKVIAYPANYHAHVEEMKTGTGLISRYKANGQGFFLKSSSSLSGPADPIVLPPLPDRQIHHECELAIIIGKGGRDIPRASAIDHIFGYACLIDVVVRGKEERVMRKSYDTFCPLGPWLVTRDEVPDPADIDLELTVNGELRQQANTRDLIVDIPEMVRMASCVMTLQPGDVIATGTPAGVGPIDDGDKVTIRIANVGTMTLDVIRGQSGFHEVWDKPATD